VTEVVRMVDADVDRVAPILARAFAHDPLFAWVEPDATRRATFLERFMRALAWRSHLFAEAWTTSPPVAGASLWAGPELGPLSAEQLTRSGLDRAAEDLEGAARQRYAAFDAVREVVERVAPLPRWYLGVLAVDPAEQGRGMGDALIAPGLARADADGLPASLETLNERNLSFYRRHGFEQAAEGRVPEGGPAYWVLRREPRARGFAAARA
jgi:ribosomal protein S18 acetylase RimI-like enzyme